MNKQTKVYNDKDLYLDVFTQNSRYYTLQYLQFIFL